eukprot:scaffold1951_cov258-Pinguiococcus_pyrenoidosus.AAC.28
MRSNGRMLSCGLLGPISGADHCETCCGYAPACGRGSSDHRASNTSWIHPILRALTMPSLQVDLHASQIQGFVTYPIDNLYALPILRDFIRTQLSDSSDLSDIVIVSPDAGGAKRAVSSPRAPSLSQGPR